MSLIVRNSCFERIASTWLQGWAKAILALPLLSVPGLAETSQDPPNEAPVLRQPASTDTVKPGAFWRPSVQRADFRPLTGDERWQIYWKQAYWTPGAFFRSAGPALGAHLADEPEEWGQGTRGYARRFGNRFARTAVRDSITAAASAAIGYDVRYVRSDRKGFLPRLGHALLWNFLTLDREGKAVFNAPKAGSTFAAEFIGSTWMPDGHRSAGRALRGAGMSLAVESLFSVIREFAPRKKTR